jgi:predicted nucleic-acid-binding protein
MKITVDTNILVRAVVRDEKRQSDAAAKLLQEAELIAVSLPCLCEFVWVPRRVYGFARPDIAAAVEALLDADNVATNRQAVDAGLTMLGAGGDFADGVIAFEGRWLGGETFISFDKKAVSLVATTEQRAQTLEY